jgi:hypothetical protein
MFNPKQNILDQQLQESGLEANIFDAIADIFTGGASTQNKHAKKVSKETNKYNAAVYKYEGEELDRRYNYEVEGLEIQRGNLLQDLQFQANTRQQDWNYGMAIRDFEFSQDMRAYEQSVAQAAAQQSFNAMAAEFANLQADRHLMEQQIELELSGQETLLAYTAQAHGLMMKKKKTKAAGVSQLRKASLSSLKAQGQAAARGQSGRSAGKTLNAIQAETNAVESEIVEELMSDTKQIDMDLLVSKMQNMQDNLALELSKNNLIAADTLNRQQISLQRQQADLQAQASVMLKPQLMPPLPKPMALPIPQMQDIYEPKQGPKPMKSIPYQANIAGAFFRNSLNIATQVVGMTGGG